MVGLPGRDHATTSRGVHLPTPTELRAVRAVPRPRRAPVAPRSSLAVVKGVVAPYHPESTAGAFVDFNDRTFWWRLSSQAY